MMYFYKGNEPVSYLKLTGFLSFYLNVIAFVYFSDDLVYILSDFVDLTKAKP